MDWARKTENNTTGEFYKPASSGPVIVAPNTGEGLDLFGGVMEGFEADIEILGFKPFHVRSEAIP